eukprot:scaffold358_cov290-Prasinococcus_capsulatus_cf.AAC.2
MAPRGPLPKKSWEIDFRELETVVRIGRGASGEVLKAVWNGTDVAVKRLWWDTFTPEGSVRDGKENAATDGNNGGSARDQSKAAAAAAAAAATATTTAQRNDSAEERWEEHTIVMDPEVQEQLHAAFNNSNSNRACGASAAAGADDKGERAAAKFSFEEFEREVEVLTNLRHPNIVLFLGACRTPPNMCLVMEYCPRGSMDKLIHNPDVVLDRYVRVCGGRRRPRASRGRDERSKLTAASLHAGGARCAWPSTRRAACSTCTRSSRPSCTATSSPATCSWAPTTRSRSATLASRATPSRSVSTRGRSLLDGSRRVVARALAARVLTLPLVACAGWDVCVRAQTQRLTAASHQVGTPGYIAPEILRDDQYSKKCDLWSYGIVLWELMTRQRPYAQYKSPLQVMAAVAFHGACVRACVPACVAARCMPSALTAAAPARGAPAAGRADGPRGGEAARAVLQVLRRAPGGAALLRRRARAPRPSYACVTVRHHRHRRAVAGRR